MKDLVVQEAVIKWSYNHHTNKPMKILVHTFVDKEENKWYIPVGDKEEEYGWLMDSEAFDSKYQCCVDRRDGLMLQAEEITLELEKVNKIICEEI